MPQAPYYIIIRRTNQVLLSFLDVRVVVNNTQIYQLVNDQPVVIAVEFNHPSIVITDGFHFTHPRRLDYKEPGYYRFQVECVINDFQLAGGALVLVLLYLLGFATGIFIWKLLSFVPLLVFIFLFYLNRKRYIRLKPVAHYSRY